MITNAAEDKVYRKAYDEAYDEAYERVYDEVYAETLEEFPEDLAVVRDCADQEAKDRAAAEAEDIADAVLYEYRANLKL